MTPAGVHKSFCSDTKDFLAGPGRALARPQWVQGLKWDLNFRQCPLSVHLYALKDSSPQHISATYPSIFFWCELHSFGDTGRRDFCLLSSIMGLNGALLVVLTAPKNIFQKLNSYVSLQKS